MTCLEAYTDPGAVILINRFLCQNNKSGHIAVIFADILCQNLQIVNLSGSPTGNCCVSLILICADLFGRCGGVGYCCGFPISMLFQIFLTLGEPLRMGIYPGNIGKLSLLQAKQHMLNLQDLLSHDKQIIFCQKVINICHNPSCGIFNRKDCVICSSCCNFFHGIPEQLHMIALNVFLKVGAHGSIAVGALYPLENNSHIISGKLLHHLEVFLFFRTIFGEKLILTLSADGHDLLKKLLGSKFVELTVRFFPDLFQFGMLSLRIQHFLSGMDLILCNLFADLHPLLKKFHHLIVNFIYFSSAFLQICHIVFSPVFVFNHANSAAAHFNFHNVLPLLFTP